MQAAAGRRSGRACGAVTDERRYQEDEIRQIFQAATTARDPSPRALSPAEGLTLAELQGIGLEVGVAPERIAEAAAALDRRGSGLPRRTHWGMPISVGRTVDLPRAPTDREWALLVAELRETFQAQGKIGSAGSLRQWTNGNLHAYVEPTEAGHRLRLGTLKGNAAEINLLGIIGIAMGLIILVAASISGKLAEGLFLSAVFSATGVAALTSNVLRLPRWASEREDQLEHIATRAQELIGPEPETTN